MTSSSEIDVSILIVSYNTSKLTLEAIASAARETTRSSFEIIVVDNASSDGSALAIATHSAKPRLIALDENIGFAAANNLAANEAHGRYVLLLNPDTIVLDGAIDALVAFAGANPAAKIWGGRTLFSDGRLNPASCWGRMTLWNQVCRVTGLTAVFSQSEFFNGEAYGGWQRECVRHVDIVSGCFFLISRDFWTELGGFDPHFYMYGEEADLCLRAHKRGARPMVTPAATIVHLGGASEPARTAKMIKLLSAKASLIERHWHPLLSPIGKRLQAIWPLSRATALSVASAVTGSQAQRQAARTWYEIWTERAAWRNGYLAAVRPVPAAATPTAGPADAGALIERPEGAHPAAYARVPYTIATLINNPRQYITMLASFRAGGFSSDECEYLFIDNSSENQVCAYRGLDAMLAAARGDIVLLCHQDVRLLSDGRATLDARLAGLQKRDPDWALAGNAGAVAPGSLALRITDPHGANQCSGELPARVMSLDENFIAVKRTARIGFSRDLSGFHFYGADICLNAATAGYNAYVIDFHLAHLSPGNKSPSFYAAEDAFRTKWSAALAPRWLQTTCTLMRLSGDTLGQIAGRVTARPLASFYRRHAKVLGGPRGA